MDCDQIFAGARTALERCGQMLDTLAFAPLTLSDSDKEQVAQTLLVLSERISLQSGLALQEVAESGMVGAEPVLAVLRDHVSLSDQLLPDLWAALQSSLKVEMTGSESMGVYA